MKECLRCGRDTTYKNRKNDNYCPSCRVYRSRQNAKKKAVDLLGGKCEKCGYNKCMRALEFHHKDPAEKDFQIARSINAAWTKVKEELKKCILVCNRCHSEIHDEIEKNKYDGR